MDREEFNRVATQKEIERSRWIGEQWERRLIKNNKKGDENLYDCNLLPMLTISKNFFWGDHFSTLDEFYNAKQDEMKRLLIGRDLYKILCLFIKPCSEKLVNFV